jgi:hypothetical protein
MTDPRIYEKIRKPNVAAAPGVSFFRLPEKIGRKENHSGKKWAGVFFRGAKSNFNSF